MIRGPQLQIFHTLVLSIRFQINLVAHLLSGRRGGLQDEVKLLVGEGLPQPFVDPIAREYHRSKEYAMVEKVRGLEDNTICLS